MQSNQTDYITVNVNGIFVGGKIATEYRGSLIFNMTYVKEVFVLLQKKYPEISEFHVGAFATRGEFGHTGNPLLVCGPNGWCRLKLKNGEMTSWVFCCTCDSAISCATFCAFVCSSYVCNYAYIRAVLLSTLMDKIVESLNGKDLRHLIVDSVHGKQK